MPEKIPNNFLKIDSKPINFINSERKTMLLPQKKQLPEKTFPKVLEPVNMKIEKSKLNKKIVLPTIKFKINSRNYEFMSHDYESSEVET